MMNDILKRLRDAEGKAALLFEAIEKNGLIRSGITEKQLNTEIYQMAEELLGVKKYWHKRIVRAGKNTLLPYAENPPDLLLQDDDILFLDFGPVFEDWEADFGRTYVIGNNERKKQLKEDTERAFVEGKAFYDQRKKDITGAELYAFTAETATRMGWEYGNEHCGHLVGFFPHERLSGEDKTNYIHPDNNIRMSDPDKRGEERFWIYEIHLVDRSQEIGGFFEQLLS